MSDAIAGSSEETVAPTEGEPSADVVASGTEPEVGDEASSEPLDGAESIDPAAVEDAVQEVAVPADEVPPADGLEASTAAADLTSTPSMPAAVAAARSGRRERVQLRSSMTLGLFAIGLLVGAVTWRLVTAPPSAVDTLPSLPVMGEPPVAAVVAQHLAANDAQALSESLEQEVLDAIRAQLSPLTTLERVTFVNAASLDNQIVAAYVVEGTDASGVRGIVGLILIVRDGAVVAQ